MNRVTSDIAEDHSNCSSFLHAAIKQTRAAGSAGSNEPFKPLNLTYSLVKEHAAFATFSVLSTDEFAAVNVRRAAD
jgi:hypothetical protein